MVKQSILIVTFLVFPIISLFSQFKAVCIPEDKLSIIRIDGDTSDWNWFPNSRLITKQSMNISFKANPNETEESWGCEIKVAWSDIENKIFILAKTFDDLMINNSSSFYLNDCMQFVINAINGSGKYGFGHEESKPYCIKGHILFNTDNVGELTIREGPKWLEKNNSKCIKYDVSSKTDANGRIITVYEVSMVLWDEWLDIGEKYSMKSKLYSNKIMRLGLIFVDTDYNGIRNVEWATQCSEAWFSHVDYISQFTLDAPVEKGISWNNINYLLKPE